MHTKIAIIGAGVIGLTSAIKLQENGFDVTIFARDIQENIASRAAPAFWIPYKAAPEEAVLKWAKESLSVYQHFGKDIGVELLPYQEFHAHPIDLPWWAKIVTDYDDIQLPHLPLGFTVGYAAKLYRIDSSIYVDYLIRRFQKQNGMLHQMAFQHLDNVPSEFQIIINCCGVSSSTFVNDPDSYPIRGQFLLTEKPEGFNTITFTSVNNDGYTLIVPRTNDCYIGGTTNEGDWNMTPDASTSTQILNRATAIVPALAGVNILKTGVGLRPGRKTVRVQTEKLNDQRTVVHNYGHGGAGFTISWGCADEVVKLVQQI
ncbi:MAG: FAD-dependent oxidoreductase [Gammaproteobacteria bacterium]|nr:FAD-dependent oxidoreductase [Gammaproteobacteria bacterium]